LSKTKTEIQKLVTRKESKIKINFRISVLDINNFNLKYYVYFINKFDMDHSIMHITSLGRDDFSI
jgi:hypothetical protein